MNVHPLFRAVVASAFILFFSSCATESSHTVSVQQVESAAVSYNGPRTPISVGKFDNRSNFMRGLFGNGVDRLGGQARSILITHLQQTNRFNVLDRDNMTETKSEAKLSGSVQTLKAANYVITGGVSEFGRKQVGDKQLFGLLGRGKKQIAYAKVSINLVKVTTGEMVYSTLGAGEYTLSNREVLGFGGTASYDATLNGKVLDLAIRDAVNKLTSAIDSGVWSPES
jgi:curli biogenesis system outer membrane secretion channel CsgG